MNLQHWDLKDEFTIEQVARLISGWDPEMGHTDDAALAAKIRFVERELSRSVENAMQGALTFFDDDLDKLGDASWVVRIERGWLPTDAVVLAIEAYRTAKAKLAETESAEQRTAVFEHWNRDLTRHYTSIERKLFDGEKFELEFRQTQMLTRQCVHRWLTSLGL
jgi:hypothetical protein